jgi:hypothetical protein
MGVGIRTPPSTSSLAEINGSSLQLRNRGWVSVTKSMRVRENEPLLPTLISARRE